MHPFPALLLDVLDGWLLRLPQLQQPLVLPPWLLLQLLLGESWVAAGAVVLPA